MTYRKADVSSLRMLRKARDRIDRDYREALVKRGVEFTSPPAERPYGIEAILRDDSGNWFSFTQRKQQW